VILQDEFRVRIVLDFVDSRSVSGLFPDSRKQRESEQQFSDYFGFSVDKPAHCDRTF